MNYSKLLIFMTVFVMTSMNSQTNTMVTTNIQSHLINKFWTSKIGDNNKVVFNFTQNSLSLYIGKNKIGGDESYYLAEYDEVKTTTTFSDSKIGRLSSGNHIVTKREIYLIEFFSDFQKFRIKKILDGSDKWQTYYLTQNFVAN
jgi:hypothetical protein